MQCIVIAEIQTKWLLLSYPLTVCELGLSNMVHVLFIHVCMFPLPPPPLSPSLSLSLSLTFSKLLIACDLSPTFPAP